MASASDSELGLPAVPASPALGSSSILTVLRDHLALAKPMIVVELLVTAAGAMVVAHGALPSLGAALATLFGLGLSAGGANAVNMWYDRDIDQVMQRTQRRPVPTGRIPAERSLWLGVIAEVAATALLAFAVNPLAAALSLAGFVYYVFIYTFWLKRSTPQNIVIGGGAGAFPPLVGWAAMTGHVSWAAVLMFLIVFLWTPPHFWALALYRQDDYRRAGVPMMPVVRGDRSTKLQSLAYAVALLAASVALYLTHVVGTAYLVIALALGLGFVAISVRLLAERAPDVTWAKRTFRYSLVYLTVVFGAMVLDVPHLFGG